MKQIVLKNLNIENFKGLKSFSGTFTENTEIFGKNAVGKTTVFDSLTWLLFDKDSKGNSNFSIRPKDENGDDVNSLEVKVEGTFLVDEETVILTKTQRQKWTKKRGHSERVFEGNENIFEIDNYPAKKTEYTAKVSSIIEESLFRLMTDPTAFANLPWKEQRQILVRFVSDITDADILALDEETFEPIKDEVLAVGVDMVRDKYNATQKKLKEEQATYPIRIDEASRGIVETQDKAILMEKKAESESMLKDIEEERRSLSAAPEAVEVIFTQITKKQRRMAEIERSTMLEDEKKNLESTKVANTALMEIRKAESERDALANKRNFLEAAIKESSKAKDELRDQYVAVASAKFPESETICPTCGRPFDSDRVEELKADFEKRRQAQIDALNKRGFALKDKIESYEADRQKIEKQIVGYTADIEGLNAKWEELKKIADFPVKTDYTTLPEYQELQAGIDVLNKQLASVDDTSSGLKDLEERETFTRLKLNQIEAEIAACDANKQSKERVEELKAAQRDCGQIIADCERIIYLLEEFTQLKMNTLSDRINSHFEKVRFKLFEKLINGSVKETCQMQICTNGSYVDYASANRSGQIIGGIDVIHALKELNQISAPIWIDNAECFSSDNIPTSDSQVILLTVSDDEKLVIERR